MAIYTDVQPGQRFQPSAQRENDISHLLNAMNGENGGGISGGLNRQCNEAKVNCSGTFTQGTAVMFGTTRCADDPTVLEAIPFDDAVFSNDESIPFGVMVASGTNAITQCVTSGIVSVAMNTASTASATSFVKPSTHGLFEYNATGFPIIQPATNGYALVDVSRGVGGGCKMFWAVQTGSGSPASGISVNLYDKPNGTLKGSGTAYAEPINTGCTITGASFWVVANKVEVLTEE